MSTQEYVQQKKPFFDLSPGLLEYLNNTSRYVKLPIAYNDLTKYDSIIPIESDNDGQFTLWFAALYSPHLRDEINQGLVETYQKLNSGGQAIKHLSVERIEFCMYGNSQPFRIKIRNDINDNYDYFYVKNIDASRIYGMELEHLLSPNKINYLSDSSTIIEEHIIGIPGDQFIENEYQQHACIRLAKEFVKFNERCFVRLLGDMRAYNFVVAMIPDFDNTQYRIRAIDFDQQNYEGRMRNYLPQFFKENINYVELAQQFMSAETATQYKQEELALTRKRLLLVKEEVRELLKVMETEHISKPEYVKELKEGLIKYHKNSVFNNCHNMGTLLKHNIEFMLGVQI